MDNSELRAMAEIDKVLSKLQPEEIQRVMRWVADKFKLATLIAASPSHLQAAKVTGPGGPTPSSTIPGSIASLADLFEMARPESETELVLVMGFGFQLVQGQPEFEAYPLNRELKNFGHNLSNVSRAISELCRSKPALVIQTQKKGDTRQAKKKFKLTVAGVKQVEKMIEATRLSAEQGK